jgi:gliding motility-associated-like protein
VVRNGDCPDSCSYALQVIDIPHELWLPDAFTPNGDNRNDLFHVITDNPNVQVINLDVYNRWGQRVFTSNLNNEGWNGTFHGGPAAAGTYFWQLRYRILGSEETVYNKKGDVLLIR